MNVLIAFIAIFLLLQQSWGTETFRGYVISCRYGVSEIVSERHSTESAVETVAIAGHMLENVKSISAGDHHCLALEYNGRVVAWGTNGGGKSTPPDELNNVVSIAAGGTHSLALKADGTVFGWGDISRRTLQPGDLHDIVGIAAGFDSCLALKKEGTVVGWGRNVRVPIGLSNVVAVSVSKGFAHEYYLALRKDGTVAQWDNRNGELRAEPGLSNIVAIAAGAVHNLALKMDGTVAAWGLNSSGQTDVPPDLKDVVAIAASGTDYPATGFSLALKKDGTIVTWGKIGARYAVVPKGLTNIIAISAGGDNWLALTTNRAVAQRFRKGHD